MQFLEERTHHLFRLGTVEWLGSPRVGDAVSHCQDPDSYGIVLGQSQDHVAYVAWTRQPSAVARQVMSVAEEIQEEIDRDIIQGLCTCHEAT